MQLQLSLNVADRLHEALLVRGEPLDSIEAVRMLMASSTVPPWVCRDILATLVHHDERFVWDGIATAPLSLRHWELPDPDLVDVPFVALDLETTGARAGPNKITEIGAVRFEGFRQVAHFDTLVNPLRPIPPMITQLTGISQDMVADAPRIEEVIQDLIRFLDGAVIVAHNATFDVGFLNYELHRLRGCRLGEGAIDTLPLARALVPGLPNYRLHTVAEALGAPVTAHHRALADAQAAGHVFITLVGRLQNKGITRLEELRAYLSPSSRFTLEKLRLTRGMPRGPGTYRFVDKDGNVLYVGKADQLDDTVRSHFKDGAGRPRKLRQAVRLVEDIDWDETSTPLEAVVHEQRLILKYRPSCNTHGTRPETYAYIRVGTSGRGLGLCASRRPPRRFDKSDRSSCSSPQALVIGPFRGRTRLQASIDVLRRCYPIRHCPRNPEARPCARGESGECLAPCADNPRAKVEHDALVLRIIDWLTGHITTDLPDPLERAEELATQLSRQQRYEEARGVREAREHLASLRRSYASLAEAYRLRFGALWAQTDNRGRPLLRLNLVCNGRLLEPVSFDPDQAEKVIAAALETIRFGDPTHQSEDRDVPVAVPQVELDSLLAVRRWFHDTETVVKVPLPGPGAHSTDWASAKARLMDEVTALLEKGAPAIGS